jgi:hypothetical protein
MLKRLLGPAPSPVPFAPPPRAPGSTILSDAWWQWLSAIAGAPGERPRDLRGIRSRP